MRKLLIYLVFSLLLAIPLVAQTSLTGTVDIVVSIHETADSASPVLAETNAGDRLEIIGSVEGKALLTITANSNAIWYQVNYGDVSGYVWSGFVFVESLDSLVLEGQALLEANEAAAAQEEFEAGLELAESINSDLWRGEFYLLIAQAQAAQGLYEDALASTTSAMEIYQVLQFQSQIAQTYIVMGDIAELSGELNDASLAYSQALYIYQQLESVSGLIEVKLRQARIAIKQGSFSFADTLIEEIIELDSEGIVSLALLDVQTLYAAQIGDYGTALEGYEVLISSTEDARKRARFIRSRADIYTAQGRYGLAQEAYLQAFDTFETLNDWREQVLSLQAIGKLYSVQGRFTLAGDNFRRAIELIPEGAQTALRPDIMRALGQTLLRQGLPAQAITIFEQALSVQTDSVSVQLAIRLDLGQAYVQLGEDSLALQNFHEVNETASFIGDDGLYTQSLLYLGEMYLLRSHYDISIDYFTQWLDYRDAQVDRVAHSQVLVRIGLAYELYGDVDLAIENYLAAINLNENILSDAASSEAIISLSNSSNVQVPYQRLSVIYAKQGETELALEYAERSQAVISQIELQSDFISLNSNAEDGSLSEEAALRLEIQDKQNIYYQLLQSGTTADTERLIELENEMGRLRQQYAQLLDRLSLEGEYRNQRLAIDVASLAQIQAALSADTSLLLYSSHHRSSQLDSRLNLDAVVFVITADSVETVILPAESLRLGEAALANFSADRLNGAEALTIIYEAIFEPVADKILSPNLIIAADGFLTYVPFVALPVGDGSYLIDKYAITMADSGTSLYILSRSSTDSASTEALVLAQADAPGLPSLLRVESEALAVANIFGVTPFLDATEANLIENVEGSRVLWISAHAELSPFSPLFSALHLAPSENSDGRLEVHEIYQLNLSSTELVVLSACETAVTGNGNDFGQLNRAFLAAGTPRVIASLWTVDDEATTMLLSSFAEFRQEGMTDSVALQQAMIALRSTYAEPYYWAAFTLTGQP